MDWICLCMCGELVSIAFASQDLEAHKIVDDRETGSGGMLWQLAQHAMQVFLNAREGRVERQ